VQRRVKALKRLQRGVFDIEVMYFEELHALEHKYENLYSSLFDKVIRITTVVFCSSEFVKCDFVGVVEWMCVIRSSCCCCQKQGSVFWLQTLADDYSLQP